MDEHVLTEMKKNLATSSLDPASLAMEVIDEGLFAGGDASSIDAACLAPGGVMQTARDKNAFVVEHAQHAQPEGHYQDLNPGTAAQSAARAEMNKSKANGCLVQNDDAAEASQSAQDEGIVEGCAELADQDGPARNNILPFLVDRITKVLG